MKQTVVTLPDRPVIGEPEKVCTLINSIFYFVDNVFITENGNKYWLVVRHNGRVLIKKSYPTLRGAKIAFSKLFGYRSWRENVKAEWSKFYNADNNWLEVKKHN